ncbi:MAG: hypothetical protein E8D45_01380 [Nitrospira sp.]|nr:MAG: hypothetical protein E8D45_01380 [Nitrospira sp.]
MVAAILQRKGYWTQTSVKVDLTKAEKRRIGRHSSPRWELDVVAYKGRSNELLVVECKSFLDSAGVSCEVFQGRSRKGKKRYKLFFEPTLRKVVMSRLKKQLTHAGFCGRRPSVVLALAAGKVKGDEAWLAEHFSRNHWKLFGPTELRAAIEALQDSGYENSVASVVTKLLLRKGKTTPSNQALHPTAAGVDR